jgi:alkylhydroperoxidase family enzyme
MRLGILDRGHRLPARLFFGMTRLMSGVDMSDVPKTLLYRPEFFGRPMLELSASAMRGPSYWTAGEREYLAMVTAGWHRSPYCAESHTEMVRIAGTGEIDAADPNSARPELRAVLGFLESVSCSPDEVEAVRDVPARAVLDALRVNVIWNVVNRLANAFAFQLRPGQLEKGTRALHRFGYRFPGFLTGGVHKGHSDPIDDLRASVFDGPGATDPVVRKAAGAGDPLPEPWPAYATLVRDASYRVTDADVDRLKSAGHTEDEIFEITVAAAVGAALRSYDAGLRVSQT